jgi:hypothetical protein
MGLLPQLMLCALIVAAFAVTAQQRLAIASHSGPAPARQIAHLMEVYHRSSVAYKEANPAAAGVIAAPPPGMTPPQPVATFFASCADGHSVVTTLTDSLGAYRNQQIARELSRQALDQVGEPAQIIGVPGIGLSTGNAVQTGLGLATLPANCTVAAGLPAVITQAVP